MAAFRSWAVILAGLLVCLQQTVQVTAAETPQLPTCAVSCLLQSIPQTPCSLDNTTCICTNAGLTMLMNACVTGNCTVKEMLTTRNVTAITCNEPVRNKQGPVRATTIVMAVVGGVAVIIRCGYQLLVTRPGNGFWGMEADDWSMLATGILGVPQIAIEMHGTLANGLGRDVWTLPVDNNNQTIYRFGRYIYILEIFYFVSLMMLKLTLLLFYQRIFQPARTVRWVLRGTIAFVVGVSLLFILLGAFQCRPVSYFWTGWDREHDGRCAFSTNDLAWAHAAFSIATDLWMLAVPLWQLRHLKMHWRKKVGVALMFCVGTFVTIVSILRLRSLVSFTSDSNPTWANADVSYWSTVEIGVGTICACMPALRLILVRISPSIFGGSSARHYASGDYYGRGNNNNDSRNQNQSTVRNSNHLMLTPQSKTPTQTTIAATDPVDTGTDGKASINASSAEVEPHSRSHAHRSHLHAHKPSQIMYTTSYAVEYGGHNQYHDEAELVVNGDTSPNTSHSSRGSNTSAESS